jgi:hypothetical protein
MRAAIGKCMMDADATSCRACGTHGPRSTGRPRALARRGDGVSAALALRFGIVHA